MKFPKLRRREYEDDYSGYESYDDVYDNVDDLGDEMVEESYNEEESSYENGGAAFEMKIITPKSYEDRESIARCLLKGNAVFLNIENLNRENIIRLMDYLSGVIYVIDGKVKWSNSSSIIFAPKNVNISGIGEEETVASSNDEDSDDYN